jgi:hypothetical protein
MITASIQELAVRLRRSNRQVRRWRVLAVAALAVAVGVVIAAWLTGDGRWLVVISLLSGCAALVASNRSSAELRNARDAVRDKRPVLGSVLASGGRADGAAMDEFRDEAAHYSELRRSRFFFTPPVVGVLGMVLLALTAVV